jgi:hypothetical protein
MVRMKDSPKLRRLVAKEVKRQKIYVPKGRLGDVVDLILDTAEQAKAEGRKLEVIEIHYNPTLQ